MQKLREKSDFVIVGGVAAGPKTAATLARRNPGASITLFQREEYLSYATCGFPFFASGEVGAFEELLKTPWGEVRGVDFFERSKGFRAVASTAVTRVDREKKTVTVKSFDTGKVFEHGYGKLILATGSAPKGPPFPIPESDFVRAFTRPVDAIDFRQRAQRGEIEKVVIVGGGFIGVELCEAVKDMWGIETTLFEEQPQVLPYILDPEMAAMAERSLMRKGVGVFTGVLVEKIELDSDSKPAKPVVFVNGREPAAADYVFLCLGVRSEAELARQCGLDIGDHGGILVDGSMRTSDPDIYAGGDCVETVHAITKKPVYLPMGSLANRHGRVIAENLSGGAAVYPGVLGAFVMRAFETNIGGVGLSENAARREGLEARTVWGSFPDRPDYNPEMNTLTLKMVYEENSNRLLGLQAVGKGDICRRIDVFSTFLRRGGKVDDLFDFEHCYAPPFSEALDPLHHLAGIAKARQRGAGFISPGSLRAKVDKDTVVLDVRGNEEGADDPIPPDVLGAAGRSLSIPLSGLRGRLDEIERGKRILLFCRRGVRSYQAALILKAAGFERVDILAAGMQAQE